LTRREGESTGRCILDTVLAGGAKALQQPIGALAEGFRANIVVLNENHPDLALRRGDEWLDAWIFMIGREAVRSVLVGGQTVVEGGDHVRQREIEARYRTVGEHFSAD
jgi:cytosine/adenosine deaminase-related metal-dependent hydrolase